MVSAFRSYSTTILALSLGFQAVGLPIIVFRVPRALLEQCILVTHLRLARLDLFVYVMQTSFL